MAGTCWPLVIISSAFSTPTMRGRRCVPPAPGSRPRFTSGRPQLRARHGDAVVRAQRDFQAAAQRRAVDRGDDRLGRVLHLVLHVEQAGALHRAAELGDVGAGDEGAALADQHDGLDGRIGDGLLEALDQPVAHVGATARSPAANSA